MAVRMSVTTVCLLGNAHSGKSVLAGGLLYSVGGVSERERQRAESDVKELGSDDPVRWKASFVMRSAPERKGNHTLHPSCARELFVKPGAKVQLHDPPGLMQYSQTRFRAMHMAEIVVLVLNPGNIEASVPVLHEMLLSARVQCREGFRAIAVVSQLDRSAAPQGDYDKAAAVLHHLLKAHGVVCSATVPVSSLTEANIVTRHSAWPWYTGPTFLEALQSAVEAAEATRKAATRKAVTPTAGPAVTCCSIMDRYRIMGIGFVAVARLTRGRVSCGMTTLFSPSGHKGQVKTLEHHHCMIEAMDDTTLGSACGMNVKVTFPVKQCKKHIHRGELMYMVPEDKASEPADSPDLLLTSGADTPAHVAFVELYLPSSYTPVSLPDGHKAPSRAGTGPKALKPGITLQLVAHHWASTARVSAITRTYSTAELKSSQPATAAAAHAMETVASPEACPTLSTDPQQAVPGQFASVVLEMDRPSPLVPFATDPNLGRVLLHERGRVIAMGVVRSVQGLAYKYRQAFQDLEEEGVWPLPKPLTDIAASYLCR